MITNFFYDLNFFNHIQVVFKVNYIKTSNIFFTVFPAVPLQSGAASPAHAFRAIQLPPVAKQPAPAAGRQRPVAAGSGAPLSQQAAPLSSAPQAPNAGDAPSAPHDETSPDGRKFRGFRGPASPSHDGRPAPATRWFPGSPAPIKLLSEGGRK